MGYGDINRNPFSFFTDISPNYPLTSVRRFFENRTMERRECRLAKMTKAPFLSVVP